MKKKINAEADEILRKQYEEMQRRYQVYFYPILRGKVNSSKGKIIYQAFQASRALDPIEPQNPQDNSVPSNSSPSKGKKNKSMKKD